LARFIEEVGLKGKVHVWVFEARTMRLLQVSESPNLIVTAGKQALLERVFDVSSADPFTYIAVGSGSSTPDSGDTTLESEIARKAAENKSRSGNTVYVNVWFGSTEGNGYTWAEAGLFNAGSGGTMFSRALFNPTVEKTSDKVVLVEWQISWS